MTLPKTTPVDARAGNGGKSASTVPLEIDPPQQDEVLAFRAEIRVVSHRGDPYGLRRLRKMARLLDTSDIHLGDLQYVLPAAELPDPRAGKLLAEADRLRRESDASRQEVAEIIGRHRRRGEKQRIRNADWDRDSDQ